MTENTVAQKEIERNLRWNFLVNALDGVTFWFGMSFISTAIILPLYVSHFTKNPLLIGLIPFIATAGTFVPQLFMANAVARAPRKKFFPVTLGLFLERLPVFLLVLLTYFLAKDHPLAALVGFYLLHTWHSFGAGVIIIGWQDMIAKIFPVETRGRFFGITNFIGNGSGILGALAVSFVLERYTFPTGFVMSFSAATVLTFMSWFSLSLTREPPVYSSKPRISQVEYFRTLPAVLRKDRNFSVYLLAQVINWLSLGASGFLVVYAVQAWQLPDGIAGGFTIALQVGLALGNLFFGFFSDRKGHKLSLEICFLLNIVSLGLAIFAPLPAWFYLVFFLRGTVGAAAFVSSISIVYEFTGAEDRPTYIGLANTIPGIAGAIAPLIAGWLAGATSYPVMFILCALIALTSFVLLRFGVGEPRKLKPSGAASEALPAGETAAPS